MMVFGAQAPETVLAASGCWVDSVAGTRGGLGTQQPHLDASSSKRLVVLGWVATFKFKLDSAM